MVKNFEIARVFYQIAALLEARRDSRFRIRAINWVLRMAKLPLVSQFIGKQVVLESIIDAV